MDSSTRITSCVCWPGEGSGSSCESIEITSPTKVAGGLVDAGCGELRYLPAAQCGQGPRSCRLSKCSDVVLFGSLPVDKLEQRL